MPIITITLDVPEGTTFTVSQPAQPPVVSPPATPPAPPATPRPAPPAPTPPGPDLSPPAFVWGFPGQVKSIEFGAGTNQSFSVDIPEGYDAPLVGGISQANFGTPEYSNVRLWFSLTPDGPALPGSQYVGPTGQTGLSIPYGWRPPAGKRVYFNVSASGRWNVRLVH
jgi:hypothetical protein